MSDISEHCDYKQGFNFDSSKNVPVGFIKEFKLGEVAGIDSDFSVQNPEDPAAELKCFAVLHSASWSGSPTDALTFHGQISVTNKQLILAAMLGDMRDINCTFKFTCFDYDSSAKKYYESFHDGDTELKGRLQRVDSELQMTVDKTGDTEVLSPENYHFYVALVPESEKQALHVATSVSAKKPLTWGISDGS